MLLISFFLAAVIAPSSYADGGMYIKPRESESIEYWITIPEEKQIGIINFEDSFQKMILIISIKEYELEGESAVWLFPVPGDPGKAYIDILDEIPHLSGKHIKDKVKDSMAFANMFIYFSQVHSIPLGLSLSEFFDSNNEFTNDLFSGAPAAEGGFGDDDGDRLTIYEHIEEMGLTTELIGTDDSGVFNEYLVEKDLNLTEKSLSIIDEYLGSEYSFVVSWISNITEFKKTVTPQYGDIYRRGYSEEEFYVIGISIGFPTDEIFYPLKLTSVYEEVEIPILIQIIDYVTVTRPENIDENEFKIDYYIDDSYHISSNSGLIDFFSEQYSNSNEISNLKYTEITINTRSDKFTEDLWIKDEVPNEISNYNLIISYGWIFFIPIFILTSCLSSLIAGLIIFNKNKPSMKKLFLLGLLNFGSVFSFGFFSHRLIYKKNYIKLKNQFFEQSISKTNWTVIVILSTTGYAFITFFSGAMMVFYNDLVCVLSLILITPCIVIFLTLNYIVKNIDFKAFVLYFSFLFLLFNFITQVIYNLFLDIFLL